MSDDQFWSEYQTRRGPVDYANPVAAHAAMIDVARSYCAGLAAGRDPRPLAATKLDLVLPQEMGVELLCPEHASGG